MMQGWNLGAVPSPFRRPSPVYALLPLLLLGAIGCERVVSIAAPEGPKRLVVEARLERVDGAVSGAQRIRLTTTDNYFSRTLPPPASGANVRVADDSGRVVPFAEVVAEPGTYTTSALVMTPGRSYTLRITWSGEEYASTERMLPAVPVDSLYFAKRLSLFGPRDGLRATISVNDPVGVKNFYLWDQFVDGRRLLSDDSSSFARITTDDEFFDGGSVTDFQPFGGIVVKSGQLVAVRQVAISQQAQLYYEALTTQALNDGSPFGVAPANLRGNVLNLTRPGNPALGYFIAAGVSEVSKRVP
jgi:hypothetical protein